MVTDGMGERGSNSFFRSEIWEISLFEPRKIQLRLASSILPVFLTLSFPSTVAFGLNSRFPGRFLLSNRRYM